MARAIKLAARGRFTTSPNPNVGCVIVNDGKIVGEGWHQVAGGPHAEVNALNQAGEQAKGATCYVTLEPCSHFGKTPPCADALIKAGVGKVIAAMVDPNPQVSGAGLEKLNAAGIQTHFGLLQADAEALNPGFIKRMKGQGAFVRCKMACTLDGKTALSNGVSQWITGPEARSDVQRFRAQSCAIISGADTV
ncbi:MAG: bifunctional diaminohydroxyphosphoribosylaminopyrimidine deaminase/5-amino-6-(5-phosphoribosylamino)uracil reductase RibD, partial [Psychrosphaera sp.]|nr:bifunctional diaminohydroxyphosphoribosylaminopyrimidine deaminase/5-amino-6-(5-phosphoribosylamino)uracil reductase RibD [Psychrosphaera sp.]